MTGLSAQIRPMARSSAAAPSLMALGPSLRVIGAPGSEGPLTLSKPLPVDLIVYRGDTGVFRITVANSDLSPHPILDATFDADIRLAADTATVITSMIVSPTPGDSSSVDVSLTAAMSRLINGPAVYDVEMTQGGIVTTLIAGNVVLTKDVSRVESGTLAKVADRAANGPIISLAAVSGELFPQPQKFDITIYRGDTCRFRVSIVDDVGDPVDVSASTWDADIRATTETAAPLASFTVTPHDASSVDLFLNAASSAALTTSAPTAVWDLEMKTGTEVRTVLAGVVTIVRDVSR